MKKLIIGMMFLGFANLTFSQLAMIGPEELKSSRHETTFFNPAYLSLVSKGSIANVVSGLQSKAANFDVTKAHKAKADTYLYSFKLKNGWIKAQYDRKGRIIASTERYTNIPLPIAVRNSAYVHNPDWKMVGNSYRVDYQRGMTVCKYYKVKLEKDGKRKTIKMNVDGTTL